MPIYEADEHELIKEDSTLVEGDAEIQDGTLYLTDKRLIYEKKGARSILRAAPAKTYMDVRLYDLKNISAAVPMLRIFTRRFLTVEFELDGQLKKYDFVLSDPKKWNDEIMRWVSDARRHKEEDDRRRADEQHKKEVELARAKSYKVHVGMAYFEATGKKNAKGKPKNIEVEDKNQYLPHEDPAMSPKHIAYLCESCGSELTPAMKFCPNCGKKV